MDAIVSAVAIYGDKKTDESNDTQAVSERHEGKGKRITIERLTWPQFKSQWLEHEEAQRDPFGKYTGGFDGQFAVRVRGCRGNL